MTISVWFVKLTVVISFNCWTVNYSIRALNELPVSQIDQTTVRRYQEKHALMLNWFFSLEFIRRLCYLSWNQSFPSVKPNWSSYRASCWEICLPPRTALLWGLQYLPDERWCCWTQYWVGRNNRHRDHIYRLKLWACMQTHQSALFPDSGLMACNYFLNGQPCVYQNVNVCIITGSTMAARMSGLPACQSRSK